MSDGCSCVSVGEFERRQLSGNANLLYHALEQLFAGDDAYLAFISTPTHSQEDHEANRLREE